MTKRRKSLKHVREVTLKGILRDADTCADLLAPWGEVLAELNTACDGTVGMVREGFDAVTSALHNLQREIEAAVS